MIRWKTAAAAATVLTLLAAGAQAQWLKHPTRGIPRTRDGKPNLTARAPRTPDGHPDLSGIWAADPQGYGFNVASDLKPGEVLPWADALFQQRSREFAKDWPALHCLPQPGPFSTFGMFKILQTRDVVAVLSEAGDYRQIHTDGRKLPEDPQPTWMGYSVARWEKDTLVVETAGFNDRTWLDMGGHPHSEALHITERYRRKDFGHMQVEMRFEDAKAYARPWTIAFEAQLVPDTELLEYVCNENEKDVARFIVTDAERAQPAAVSPALLEKYAGTYDVQPPGGPPQKFIVKFADGKLLFQPPDGGAYEAMPVSDTRFSAGGTLLDFFTAPDGAVTHFVIYTVEGDMKGTRSTSPPADGGARPVRTP